MTEEQLIKHGYTFPERINILLCKNKEGKLSLTFTKFKNKKVKIENIKHSDTGALFLDGSIAITLGVKDYETFEDFYNELESLKNKWVQEETNE